MLYNFENLSPLDFEKLGINLLEKHLEIPLIETFKVGRDWTIDGRFIDSSGITNIIQCKHYKKFSNLKQDLKHETKKIKNLSEQKKLPDLFKYILATSLGLTPKNKKEIRECLSYIKKDQDIYGRDELNSLIEKYPEIEKNHFKLWINSTNVLQLILNQDIYNQTYFQKDSIKRKIKLYVETGSINLAEKILEDNNFCIISGAPGVGKTTLAEMLIFKYLSRKYELIVISRDIKDALKVYSSKKRILFYYDDFLGTTFLKESLPKNEDSRLVEFINEVRKDKNKKFILTTREYILKQALETYEKIENADVLSGKFVLELNQYSFKNKAEILFNHLYFSEIEKEFLKNLKDNKKYRDIVRHRNFNPRLIEFMGKKSNLRNIAHNRYSDWCIQNLDNPEKIWEHAFRNVSYSSQALLYYLASSSRFPISYKTIESDFNSFYGGYCQKYRLSLISNPLQKSMKELEDSFISLQQDRSGSINISFINPSVDDFLESLIKEDIVLSKNLIEIYSYSSQIQRVLAVIASKEKNKLLDMLRDKEIQRSILELTKKKQMSIEEKESSNIFSFVFKSVPDECISSNKDFLEELLSNLIGKFKSPIYKGNVSLSECMKCLDILEKNQTLYFGRRESLLEKAKKAFCQNIGERDFLFVKDFMNKFSIIIDEQIEKQVIKEAQERIKIWYEEAINWNEPEEIRTLASDMHELEEAFNIEGYSEELDGLAYEYEKESESKIEDEDYESDTNWHTKKEDPISNEELDGMFKKL